MNSRVAVVGCGRWGRNLVRVFAELDALGCICDSDPRSVQRVRPSAAGVPVVSRLEDVLARRDIGAVAVATPAATHHAITRRCLEAGMDVFVEKPLAMNAEEGATLVALAESRRRILMVGHILLYHPAVARLRQLIEQGTLGRILYCYSNRLNMGRIRTEENILWSFAPHDVSLMLHLLGEEPVAVEAEGQSYLTPGLADVTLSRLRFKSGVTGHIFVSWLHPFKEQRFVVVGSEQMAVFDDTAEHKLVLFPHRVEWTGRSPKAVRAEPVPVSVPAAEPLKEECRHFLHCLRSRRRPLSDGHEAVRVLRVLDACQASLDTFARGRRAGGLESQAQEYFVHPTACVDMPCTIGRGTKIWHFCHVMQGATIGRNCTIGQNVYVGSDAVIGNNVKIQNNVSVYDGVVLEDSVFCGPSVVFTNVRNPRSEIARKSEYARTLIRRGATLGANATIVCGTTVGEYAFVAAGAVVTRDVAPYALVAGVPAQQIGWICRCAAGRLSFNSGGRATCPECGRAYRLEAGRVQPEGGREEALAVAGRHAGKPPGEG